MRRLWSSQSSSVRGFFSQCSNPGCMKKENADNGAELLWCSRFYPAKYYSKECQSVHHEQHAQHCSRDMIRNINHKEEVTEDCGICTCPMTTANLKTLPFYYSCCGNIICQGCLHELFSRNIQNCPYCNVPWSDIPIDEKIRRL